MYMKCNEWSGGGIDIRNALKMRCPIGRAGLSPARTTSMGSGFLITTHIYLYK